MARHADAMALLELPYVFTQDDLWNTEEFVRRASDWDCRIDVMGLQALHEARYLLPLYRVADESVEGRRLPVPRFFESLNTRSEVLAAGRDGRARDAALEGYSVAWPYHPPADATSTSGSRWWNGFALSSWQLIELDDLRPFVDFRRLRADRHGRSPRLPAPYSSRPFARARRRSIALCALSVFFLPEVLGRASLPAGEEWSAYHREQEHRSTRDLLDACGIEVGELRSMAEALLRDAHSRDPLREWLPLVRHMSSDWWFRLRGAALGCVWRRIAAEVLLRGYEELADPQAVATLASRDARGWRTAFRDRLAGPALDEAPLEEVLSRSGLSPHPRLLLLVPGETERRHIPRVLRTLVGDMPDFIRVQDLGGERTNPQLLARYAIAPRIGRVTTDAFELAAPPTALYVATDPEERFATEANRHAVCRNLRTAIRADVERQGGTVTDDVLDLLVHVDVWGDSCYELANFTDGEICVAASAVTGRVGDQRWDQQLESELRQARAGAVTLNAVLGRRRIAKPVLADALWPALESKLHAEAAAGHFITPVLRIVTHAIDIASHIPRGTVLLARQSPSAP